MRYSVLMCALVSMLIGSAAAWGQGDKNLRAKELRAQLEQIQAQLREAERQDAPGSKVTELGSSRARPHETQELQLIIRLYDLSDLFAIAPSYIAREGGDLTADSAPIFPLDEVITGGNGSGLGGGGLGGGGGGLFGVPDSIRPGEVKDKRVQAQAGRQGEANDGGGARTSMERLIHVIESTIAPDSWDNVGGAGSIGSIGSSLLISADEETHDKIASLLDLFRKRWGSLRTVSLRAHWLWLTEDQLMGALEGDQKPAKGEAYGALSPAAWKKLQAIAADNRRPGYHLVLTCHNGQTVYALAGAQRLAITGMTPVVGGATEGAVAYQPVVRGVHEGAALQITPLVTRNFKYVVLDVHSRVNLLVPAANPAEAKPAARGTKPGSIEQIAAAIERPTLESQRMATTLRIAADQTMLIGGMSFSAREDVPGNLYLFITATVQELRDDEGTNVQAPTDDPKKAPLQPIDDSEKKPRQSEEKPGDPAQESESPQKQSPDQDPNGSQKEG